MKNITILSTSNFDSFPTKFEPLRKGMIVKMEEDLKKAANLIKQGRIVVFPTETVYGIGTNGLDENAVKRVYEIKQRPLTKPISLLVSDIEMINKIAQNISEVESRIIKAFFPGPLTIILKKRECVPDIVTAGKETVGIRMPQNKLARDLISLAGVPIATPSANISGKPSGVDIKSIKKEFESKVDYFIDGGKSGLGIASTIVKVVDGEPQILRQGIITLKEIQSVI